MRKASVIVLLIGIVVFISCKKSDTTAPANATPIVFTGLKMSQDTVKVNIYDTITAMATGESLTYTWTSENGLGTFIPTANNNLVLFAGCHATDFVIDCQAKDKYNRTDTKKITVHVIN